MTEGFLNEKMKALMDKADFILQTNDIRKMCGSKVPCVGLNKGAELKQITFYLHFKVAENATDLLLTGKYSQDGHAIYEIELRERDENQLLIFKLFFTHRNEPLELSVPIDRLQSTDWHTVIIRYSGPKLEYFIDGVLVDEEWPIGTIRKDAGEEIFVTNNSSIIINCIAVWNSVLNEDEIVELCGGIDSVRKRESEILGEENEYMQYWKPKGLNTGVGDCMPFYHEGRFHLFYLFDRHKHGSKWGYGAHQWAHASTTDLVHWKHHPMAIPITQEIEGSICTGSVFYHEKIYYAYYANRRADGGLGQLHVAVSSNGINFDKTEIQIFSFPEEIYHLAPFRDPVIFMEEKTRLFHMLITAELRNPPVAWHGGCLAHLVSKDLKTWELGEPFLPGYTDQPECPDYFEWNGWYYLVISSAGVARYRMSRNPLGPWLRPMVDVFDGPEAKVLKTAAFTGNRRIGAAFVNDKGYSGNLIFRELIQHEDGSLGTKFPVELMPVCGEAVNYSFEILTESASGNNTSIHISSPEGFGAAMLSGIPNNVRISLNIEPETGSSFFGLCVRGIGKYENGSEIRFEPFRKKVGLHKTNSNSVQENEINSIYNVDGIDKPFFIDIIIKDDLLDICIDNKRTLINRIDQLNGDRLFFFAQNGTVTFNSIEVKPIV